VLEKNLHCRKSPLTKHAQAFRLRKNKGKEEEEYMVFAVRESPPLAGRGLQG